MCRYNYSLIFLVIVLGGCDSLLSVNLEPQPFFDVRMHQDLETTYENRLKPGDRDFERLQIWLDENQTGWRVYTVTLPNPDVYVDANGFTILLKGDSVFLLQPEHPVLVKSAIGNELAFIAGPSSDT